MKNLLRILVLMVKAYHQHFRFSIRNLARIHRLALGFVFVLGLSSSSLNTRKLVPKNVSTQKLEKPYLKMEVKS